MKSTKDELFFDAVMDRTKSLLGVNEDKELADALGMKPTTYNNRKKRGTIPFGELVALASSRNMDIGYILTGNRSGGETHTVQEPGGVYISEPKDVAFWHNFEGCSEEAKSAMRVMALETKKAQHQDVIAHTKRNANKGGS